jgi:hypothetical protein
MDAREARRRRGVVRGSDQRVGRLEVREATRTVWTGARAVPQPLPVGGQRRTAEGARVRDGDLLERLGARRDRERSTLPRAIAEHGDRAIDRAVLTMNAERRLHRRRAAAGRVRCALEQDVDLGLVDGEIRSVLERALDVVSCEEVVEGERRLCAQRRRAVGDEVERAFHEDDEHVLGGVDLPGKRGEAERGIRHRGDVEGRPLGGLRVVERGRRSRGAEVEGEATSGRGAFPLAGLERLGEGDGQLCQLPRIDGHRREERTVVEAVLWGGRRADWRRRDGCDRQWRWRRDGQWRWRRDGQWRWRRDGQWRWRRDGTTGAERRDVDRLVGEVGRLSTGDGVRRGDDGARARGEGQGRIGLGRRGRGRGLGSGREGRCASAGVASRRRGIFLVREGDGRVALSEPELDRVPQERRPVDRDPGSIGEGAPSSLEIEQQAVGQERRHLERPALRLEQPRDEHASRKLEAQPGQRGVQAFEGDLLVALQRAELLIVRGGSKIGEVEACRQSERRRLERGGRQPLEPAEAGGGARGDRAEARARAGRDADALVEQGRALSGDVQADGNRAGRGRTRGRGRGSRRWGTSGARSLAAANRPVLVSKRSARHRSTAGRSVLSGPSWSSKPILPTTVSRGPAGRLQPMSSASHPEGAKSSGSASS